MRWLNDAVLGTAGVKASTCYLVCIEQIGWRAVGRSLYSGAWWGQRRGAPEKGLNLNQPLVNLGPLGHRSPKLA
eukprot:scaffold179502_cov41-Prasinocladus_malaysianus.AAC.1